MNEIEVSSQHFGAKQAGLPRPAIRRLGSRHRIVFWYDVKQELRQEFEAVTLPGVEKIALENNQFGVKHRVLREQPDQKFLLYHEGPPPPDLDNWLLDVQLAHGQFRADQVSLWLSEIGLGLEFAGVVAPTPTSSMPRAGVRR